MSVIEVNPFENTDGGVDAEMVRTYTNTYHVVTDDKNDGSITARMSQAIALGLPAYGDHFVWFNDSDEFAICKTRRAALVDVQQTRKQWLITCGYTTKLQKRDPASDPARPDLDPWKISGSFAVGTKAAERDKDGKALTNSAEEPVFTDIPSGHDTLILEGKTATIDLAVRAAAKLKTNSSAMWGLAPRQLLLMQWSYDIGYRNLTAYVNHRLEFHIAADEHGNNKWDFVYIDKGTRSMADFAQADPSKRYKPATARDLQLNGGIYLDGVGGVLNIATTPEGIPITKKVIREYDFLANLPFLPNPLPGPFT